jgi:hypothetical protein
MKPAEKVLRSLIRSLSTDAGNVNIFNADGVLQGTGFIPFIGSVCESNGGETAPALAVVLALSLAPKGFIVSELVSKVQSISGLSDSQCGKRRAAYDLKNLRGKKLLEISGRRYRGTAEHLRTIAAVSILRDRVIRPLLAGSGKLKTGNMCD